MLTNSALSLLFQDHRGHIEPLLKIKNDSQWQCRHAGDFAGKARLQRIENKSLRFGRARDFIFRVQPQICTDRRWRQPEFTDASTHASQECGQCTPPFSRIPTGCLHNLNNSRKLKCGELIFRHANHLVSLSRVDVFQFCSEIQLCIEVRFRSPTL